MVQSVYHFRSWDHLRYNLGIICGTGIICRPGSFAGPYIPKIPLRYLSKSRTKQCVKLYKMNHFSRSSKGEGDFLRELEVDFKIRFQSYPDNA